MNYYGVKREIYKNNGKMPYETIVMPNLFKDEEKAFKWAMHDSDSTNLTKTVAEMIDDYQMKIYELMKHAYPEMIGYTACCHEHVLENGDLDIHTKFYMERPEEKK